MPTNKEVRDKLARQRGEVVGDSIMGSLRKREDEKKAAAGAKHDAAASATAVSDSVSALEVKRAPTTGGELQFGDLPAIQPMRGGKEEGEIDELAVDYDEHSVDDDESVTVKRGSLDEWDEYIAMKDGRASPVLNELERDRSIDVTIYRTDEERDDVLKTVNAKKRKQEVLVTNEETGVRGIAHDEPMYSLPLMPPPEQWPAGKREANLLARARVLIEDFDGQFTTWRDKRLKDDRGELRVHPIPVVLFEGETEEQYEADLVSSLTKTMRDGSVRTLATEPEGQRNQRMQYAVNRMREIRAKRGIAAPIRIGNSRIAAKLAAVGASRSPQVAPQRQQQHREHPPLGAQQAPTSSAQVSSHATSPNSGYAYPAVSCEGGAQHGSGAHRYYPSPAVVAGASAYASAPSSDVMSSMVLANASSIGALQQQLATFRSQMTEENALLRLRAERLETTVKALQSQLTAEHDRGKSFHAKYAPRVKTLWAKHNALAHQVANEEEDLALPDWDENPQ